MSLSSCQQQSYSECPSPLASYRDCKGGAMGTNEWRSAGSGSCRWHLLRATFWSIGEQPLCFLVHQKQTVSLHRPRYRSCCPRVGSFSVGPNRSSWPLYFLGCLAPIVIGPRSASLCYSSFAASRRELVQESKPHWHDSLTSCGLWCRPLAGDRRVILRAWTTWDS